MKRPLSLLIGIALVISAPLFSSTLAGTITLGVENAEFGQGVLLVTNCDPNIYAQPIPISVGGTYYLSGIEFSQIDTSSCNNRDFRIKVFNSSTGVEFSPGISEIEVRLFGGFFYSLTDGIRLISGDTKGWFSAFIDNSPTLTSANLRRITLESEKAGEFTDCSVSPTISSGVWTYTFSNVGACVFTSVHSKNGADIAVVGGGGGGGGGSAVSAGFSGEGGGGGGGGGGEVLTTTTNLVANSKYLIVVGAGGSGGVGGVVSGSWNGSAGKDGYSSAGFGIRARPGYAGLGAGSNLDWDGINNSGCSGSLSDGTGGIGGNSGNNNSGANKSCSFSGGAGGGGSGGIGSAPTSSTGAAGGVGISTLGEVFGTGGAGGNGGSTSNPSNIAFARALSSSGNGGQGGIGSKGGSGSTGGTGQPGVIMLRYTP